MKQFNRYVWYKIVRGAFKGKYFLFDNVLQRGVQFYHEGRKWVAGALGWHWTYYEILEAPSNVRKILAKQVPSAILRLRKQLTTRPT